MSIVTTPRTNLLSKFKQLIVVCEVTYANEKDINLGVSLDLGRKSDDNSRNQPVLVKCSKPFNKDKSNKKCF